MKIMLAGDTHGDIRNVAHKIEWAKKVGDISRIVILGDFGVWWGHEAIVYLDEINALAKANNIQVFALPGNHENYDYWNALVNNAPATSHGWAYVRTHVLLSPRVHAFKWGGKRFVIAGGAVSVDKEYRLSLQRGYDPINRRQITPKRCWSPDEQLTEEEVRKAEKYSYEYEQINYLLTHDCSDRTPFNGRFKPDLESQIHRGKIDSILAALKPTVHFHGHMHTKYDWENLVSVTDGMPHYTQTYGLECNRDYWSWGVLDLKTDEFSLPDDFAS